MGSQFTSIIEVTGYLYSPGFATAQACPQVSTRLGPTAGIIPVKWNQSAPSKIFPIKITGLRFLNRRVIPVVNTYTASLGGSLFIKTDSHPVASVDNLRSIHSITNVAANLPQPNRWHEQAVSLHIRSPDRNLPEKRPHWPHHHRK